MSVKIVFIIIGIIFYLVKSFIKNKEELQPAGTSVKPVRKQVSAEKSTNQKSIDDIFNDFVKEVGNVKKKEVKPSLFSQNKVETKPPLDWQKVHKTQIKPKKPLLVHGDYDYASHSVDEAHQIEEIADIKSSEGEVLNFDKNEIDWHNAVIYKEILDRKYA